MEWNFNIDEAPKSYYKDEEVKIKDKIVKRKQLVTVKVIIAYKGINGNTTAVSNWQPKQEKWNLLSRGAIPDAWIEFPKHPKRSK